MSFVKGFIEDQEYPETLVSVLKYLDDNDLLSRNDTQEIARKIINGQKLHDLDTRSQRWSFYTRIEPLLKNIHCEGSGCNAQIGIGSLEEAFDYERQYGALLCYDCLINKWRKEYLGPG